MPAAVPPPPSDDDPLDHAWYRVLEHWTDPEAHRRLGALKNLKTANPVPEGRIRVMLFVIAAAIVVTLLTVTVLAIR